MANGIKYGALSSDFRSCFSKTLQISNQLAGKIENELVFVTTHFHDVTDRKHPCKNFLSFGEKKLDL